MPTEVQVIAGLLLAFSRRLLRSAVFALFLRNSTQGWLPLGLDDWLLERVMFLFFVFSLMRRATGHASFYSRLVNLLGHNHIIKWIMVMAGSSCMNTSTSRWLMMIIIRVLG